MLPSTRLDILRRRVDTLTGAVATISGGPASTVTSVAGKTGAVTLAATDISGLGAFATLSSAPASLISGLATVATTGKYSDLVSIPGAFAPSAHKSTHATGGSDSLTAADIGAASVAQSIAFSIALS